MSCISRIRKTNVSRGTFWALVSGRRVSQIACLPAESLRSVFVRLTEASVLYNSLRGRADRIKMRAHNDDADASKSSSTQDRPVIG